MQGCKSVSSVQSVERIAKDTILQRQLQYDSIYIDNSLFVENRGDTVFVCKSKVQYKYRFLRDTVYQHSIDSLGSNIEVVKVEKERYVPPWLKYLAIIGFLAILTATLYIIVKVSS